MDAISLESLNYYLHYFSKLRKKGLSFDIQKQAQYVYNSQNNSQSYEKLTLYPYFRRVTSIEGLANIWTTAPAPIYLDHVQNFTGYNQLKQSGMNCTAVTAKLYKTNVPTIRFFAESVFSESDRAKIYLIRDRVPEIASGSHTIRYCMHASFGSGELLYCANEEDPYYNYVDPGHIIVYVNGGDNPTDAQRMFITDSLTLDMNYIIALASIHPPAIDAIMQNNAYIPSANCRLALIRAERDLPSRLRDEYAVIKGKVQADFSKNTANVMIGKLTRRESEFIELNSIRISSTRAFYEAGNVSIEAPNLAEVIFAKLNPNETEWDIFTLINIYTDWVNNQFKELPLNEGGVGFKDSKKFEFKINDIPLTVACYTSHTRRSVNGHLINLEELSPVLKRASCYQPPREKGDEDNIQAYDLFVRSVSRYSLKLRDVWANGLPVKTVFLESDKSSYHQPATMKHPKLRFVLRDKKGFHLQVNVTDPKDPSKVLKTNEYRIGKFAEFVGKVESLNKQTNMRYYTYYTRTKDGFYVPNDGTDNPCAVGLVGLLNTYAAGITDEDKKSIVGNINLELGEAEKRSFELLKEACDITGTVAGTRQGKNGYVVKGKMRTYFVEGEGGFKVYDNDPAATNPYFCVVNKGDMGVGMDALVARIFALHNDEMMVKQIHTLRR